jgi:hypothetical protein
MIFFALFCCALKIRKEKTKIKEIRITLKRKYSFCIGKEQNLSFSKAFATPVTKLPNMVEILKMKIAISWAIFCGIKETAVATTPESKLQNAGFRHRILVIDATVLNAPKK